MKKIIVPLDFSECSVAALRTAGTLAKKTNAEIVMVHWYVRPYVSHLDSMTGKGSTSINHRENNKYKEEISGLMDELLKHEEVQGVQTSKLLIFEKDVADVMSLEVFRDVDLVVMGTKGASGMKEIFIGSNAQKMIRNVSCPVLSVKEFTSCDRLDNIIFVSEFGKEETVTTYKKLEPVLAEIEGNLHLLKVVTPSHFENSNITAAKMDGFVAQAGLKSCSKSVFNSSSPEEGIAEYSSNYENALICIGTKGLTGFAQFLSSSISKDLVNGLNKPLLTVRMG